ncbi:universal stress protein [Tessaracoccus lacteus]|uniref:universal stress protein n=1 Tax=Tessaracoccus lacteus TaxID=3041766 RepID=UPI0034DB6692
MVASHGTSRSQVLPRRLPGHHAPHGRGNASRLCWWAYPDLGLELVVERGEPALLINRVAAHARLTIVGSHRRGAMARFLLGSTSEQVLARLATTTIVVR